MQDNSKNFQKMQKKNRKFDDGLTKQKNSKKFKKAKRVKEFQDNY